MFSKGHPEIYTGLTDAILRELIAGLEARATGGVADDVISELMR